MKAQTCSNRSIVDRLKLVIEILAINKFLLEYVLLIREAFLFRLIRLLHQSPLV